MKATSITLLGLLLTTISCNDPVNEFILSENDPINLQINALPSEPLSDSEVDALLFMEEEEKLARDVYIKLFDIWSLQPFDNISSSEQSHMDAVLALINKYDLVNPASDNIQGKFVNQDLQKLYDDLIERGSLSKVDGLRVGGAIEEIDILDLQNALETSVDNEDITMVFESLMKGSRNHLRAFVKNLSSLGVSYSPQYLTKEAYEEIINAGIERGRDF